MTRAQIAKGLDGAITVRAWRRDGDVYEILNRAGDRMVYSPVEVEAYLAAVTSIFGTHKIGGEREQEALAHLSRRALG
jgi:hypothetical protein